jgi:hypothetical protein
VDRLEQAYRLLRKAAAAGVDVLGEDYEAWRQTAGVCHRDRSCGSPPRAGLGARYDGIGVEVEWKRGQASAAHGSPIASPT